MPLTLRERWIENRRRRAAGLPEIDRNGVEIIIPTHDYNLHRYLEQLRSDADLARAAWDRMTAEIIEGYRQRNYHGD